MRFSRAGAADQHDVTLIGEEGAGTQLLDQRDVIAALGSRGLWEAIGTRSGRYSLSIGGEL